MKTKLFFLLFLATLFSKAQINVNEGFESGVWPTGWVNNGFSLTSNGACTGTRGAYKLLTNVGNATAGVFSTPNYTSTGAQINVSLQYRIARYYPDLTTFVLVKVFYSVNNGPFQILLNESISAPAVAVCNGLNYTIPAGTVPNGSQVKFYFEMNKMQYDAYSGFDDIVIVQNALAQPPILSNISHAPGFNDCEINYNLNAPFSSATSVIKYGTDANNLNLQINGATTPANTNVNASYMISSLQPNTTYFYQIEATNSIGTSQSTVNSFTTLNQSLSNPIATYNFDNSYANVNGTNPFSSNTGTSFTTDRNGNTNAALNLVNLGSTATIPNLPYNNNPSTISVWVKYNALVPGFNFIYHYGTDTNGNGAFVNSSQTVHFSNNSHARTITTQTGIWYHYCFVFDGVQSKIYRNGTLLGTEQKTWNFINNNDIFKLGLTEGGSQNYFNGVIDDLKIYAFAVPNQMVMSLYTNNTLSHESFHQNQLQVSMYPNPVNDILNIASENEIKSIEIYNIQGQKVLQTDNKQINVSHLNAGIYLVIVQDNENNTTTQKIIVK